MVSSLKDTFSINAKVVSPVELPLTCSAGGTTYCPNVLRVG